MGFCFNCYGDADATIIDVLSNDSDLDGNDLTVTSVTQPVSGTVTLVGGVVTYVPAENFNGQVSFDYTVSDGVLTDVGTVTGIVDPENDPPVITAPASVVATEDTLTPVSISVSDVDAGAGIIQVDLFTGIGFIDRWRY